MLSSVFFSEEQPDEYIAATIIKAVIMVFFFIRTLIFHTKYKRKNLVDQYNLNTVIPIFVKILTG
jgi:hypothetical protein